MKMQEFFPDLTMEKFSISEYPLVVSHLLLGGHVTGTAAILKNLTMPDTNVGSNSSK